MKPKQFYVLLGMVILTVSSFTFGYYLRRDKYEQCRVSLAASCRQAAVPTPTRPPKPTSAPTPTPLTGWTANTYKEVVAGKPLSLSMILPVGARYTIDNSDVTGQSQNDSMYIDFQNVDISLCAGCSGFGSNECFDVPYEEITTVCRAEGYYFGEKKYTAWYLNSQPNFLAGISGGIPPTPIDEKTIYGDVIIQIGTVDHKPLTSAQRETIRKMLESIKRI